MRPGSGNPTSTAHMVPPGWLTRPEAAVRLGVGLRTLDLWRSRAWGPPAALVPCRGAAGGRRICLYHAADVDEFRKHTLPRCKFGRVIVCAEQVVGGGEVA